MNNVDNKPSSLLTLATAMLAALAAVILGIVFIGLLLFSFTVSKFMNALTYERKSYESRLQNLTTRKQVEESLNKLSVIGSTGTMLAIRFGLLLFVGSYLKAQAFPELPTLVPNPNITGAGIFLGALPVRFIYSYWASQHIERAKDLFTKSDTKEEVRYELPYEKLVNLIQLGTVTIEDLQDIQAIVIADRSGRLVSLTRPDGSSLATAYLATHLNLELGNIDEIQVMTKQDALTLLDHLAASPVTPRAKSSDSPTFSAGQPLLGETTGFDFETDQGPDKPDLYPRIIR